MNEHNFLKSLLEQDQKKLDQRKSTLQKPTQSASQKVRRRLLLHANRRGLVLVITLLICTIVTYPLMKPLFRSILVEGNMVMLTIFGGFLALLLVVFLSQQIDHD